MKTEECLTTFHRRRACTAPLSFAQERLWVIEQAAPGSATYNVPLLLRWTERVEPAALGAALRAVVDRHEALRTTYGVEDGRPVQIVGASAPIPLTLLDTTREPTDDDVAPYARQPFDLRTDVPLRCVVWRGAPEGDTVLLTIHHIAVDGWSLAPLFDDLAEAYDATVAGGHAELGELGVQYADFAAWERASFDHLDIEERVARRAAELSPPPAPLTLAGYQPAGRPRGRPRRGAQHAVAVPAQAWASVRELAARLRATPFVVLFAAFQEVLRRWSDQDEFLVGTVMANRPHPALENLVGLFVNTVPLRCRPRPDASFEALCRDVRTEAFQGLAHQRIPFDRLVTATRAASPLVTVTFGLQNTAPPNGGRAPRWRRPVLLPTATAKFDLTLIVDETPEGVVATVEHDLDCYPGDVGRRLGESFVSLLGAAVADATRRVATLPLSRRTSGAPGPWALVGERRDVRAFHPRAAATIVDCVTARLTSGDPTAPAVTCGGLAIARGALHRWADDIAHRLLGDGVGPGGYVPVIVARGGALVAAWLGTLRTGAAYAPLNLDTPADRLRAIVRAVGARVVLADEAGASVLRGLDLAVSVVDPHALRGHGPRRSPPAPAFSGDEPAVVIHTSGTTGRPKSVLVPHRGLANTALWWADDAGLGHADRVLCAVGTAFDPATFDTFRTLAAGSELVFADDVERRDGRALRRLMHAATVATMTPSLLRAVLDDDPDRRPEPSSRLRLIYLGGEPLPRSLVSEWARRSPVRLRNVYGPAEVSCTSTSAAVEPDDERPPAIGRPIWNTRAYVLGAHGEELPAGARGELYIAGVGVSPGYLGDPASTEAAFLPDPFAPAGEPQRMYRSGDRVSIRPDGLLEYLGRTDDQVKILGQRIEPAEVARRLEGDPAVAAAAVLVEGETPHLVAYVQLRRHDVAPGERPTRDDLVRPLGRWLPAAALPTDVYVVDALPLTANDKVDADALRRLRGTPLPRAAHERASLTRRQRWAAERFLTAVAEERPGPDALLIAALAPDTDFFALGGHSLLAARMLAAVERECGAALALGDFLEDPTVAGLARLRDAAVGARAPAPSAASPESRHPASSSQQRLLFLDRFAALRMAYVAPSVLELTGDLDRAALRRAVRLVLGRHPALRSRFELDRTLRRVFYRTDGPEPPVTEVDARGWSDAEVDTRVAEIGWRPFDLRTETPARAEILAARGCTLLIMTVHHIVSDGWSRQVIMAQLGVAYRAELTGSVAQLPEPVHPSALPERWSGLTADEQRALTETLLARLRGAPTDVRLPWDRPRPVVQSADGALRRVALGPEGSARWREALQQLGCTTSMGAMAVTAVALARLGGQCDFLFAFPWAGRETAAAADAVGLLIRTLIVRVDLSDGPTWRALLGRVRKECLASYRGADVPFEVVAAALHPGRDLTRPPVTPVLVTTAGEPAPPDLGPGTRAQYRALPDLRVKYELEVTVTAGAGEVEIAVAYATALFDPATIDRVLGALAAAAHELAAFPDARPLHTPPAVASGHAVRERWPS